MDCAKCSDTGVTRCPFDGQAQPCQCAGSCETEGARIGEEIPLPPAQLDHADAAMIAVREDAEFLRRYQIGEEIPLPPAQLDHADAAMIAVREDAEFLRRYSTPATDHVLAAIARAANAQALMVERMVWIFEQMLEESQRV